VTNDDYRDLLRGLSGAADMVAPVLPGAGKSVALLVGRALAFGADLVAAGRDPVVHIERLRRASPALADVERKWEEKLRRKFGVAIPDEPDTLPDIYDD
jgi:hypothetical protein